MNSAAHPTVVNLDAVDNQITIAEGNLVIILGVIIINSLVAVLGKNGLHISILFRTSLIVIYKLKISKGFEQKLASFGLKTPFKIQVESPV